MLNNRNVEKVSLLLLLLTVAVIAVVVRLRLVQAQPSSSQAQSQTPTSEYDEQTALVQAIRRGGLREAAKLKGHYVQTYDPYSDYNRFGIEKLTKGSAAIVIGVPTKNRCHLTPNGRLITTDYDVTVNEVIKGDDIAPLSAITVKLFGGKIMFPDGTTAEIETPDSGKMVYGRTYILFLMKEPDDNNGYYLTGGPSGLLERSADGKIKSHGRPIDPVTTEAEHKRAVDFLREVRAMKKIYPLPGKCCN